MGYVRNIDSYRKLFKDRILNDTVKFMITEDNYTIDDYGQTVEGAVQYRTYDGVEDIPANMYQSRAFENEELDAQTTVANRVFIEVPMDFEFNFSDVVINPDGRRFQIRKVSGFNSIDMLNEIQLAEIMNEYES